MPVTFADVTREVLLSADVVVAVDPRDPGRELALYPPPWAAARPATRTARVPVVALDPGLRDEQAGRLRRVLAALRPSPQPV